MTARPSLRRTLGVWSEEFTSRDSVRWPAFIRGREFRPARSLRAKRRLDALIAAHGAAAPRGTDLEELYRRIRAASKEEEPLFALDRRDRRRAPWVFFYLPPEANSGENWLGGQPDFVRRYTRWMKRRGLPRPTLALLHEFLQAYPSDLPTFDPIRDALAELLGSGTRPSLRHARERCRKFQLLAPAGDVGFVRKAVAQEAFGGRPVTRVLASAGFDTGLSHCRFLRSGLRKYLDLLARSEPEAEHFEPSRLHRLISLLEAGRGLRFRALRLSIAEGLLRPFVREKPIVESRKLLADFLLRHFGHPHLPTGRARWSRVPRNLREIFLEWLAERALEAFFSVMRDTALENHWRDRERFWRAYFDAGLVAEAWFALGEKAARKLKRLPDQEGAARGSLRGAGSDQSVLLMRIRGLPGFTVAEWSHNGACRAWIDGNPKAPRLYREKYGRHDMRHGHGLMRGSDFNLSHRGSWQDRLAAWMEEYTGESVPRSDYLV